MMTRRQQTVGQFIALRKNYTPAWNRLLKERPYYQGLVDGLLNAPAVRWFMETCYGISDHDQWRERLKYGLVIGYAVLGTQVTEEIMTHGGAIDTILALAGVEIIGDNPQEVVDGQSTLLLNLLTVLGEEHTPSEPALHAFTVLSKLSIDNEYRDSLRYLLMDNLSERPLPMLH